jgi:hypothetical protein
MSVQEMTQQVSLVTNPSGHAIAVQIQIEVWEEIVALLQQTVPGQKSAAEQNLGWEAFLSLATDAQPGALVNPSLHHDTYLYGQSA